MNIPRRIWMKSVKKITSKIDILAFICVTILFLFQVYGMVDFAGVERSIGSEFHKIAFAVFFLVTSIDKLDSRKTLLLGILTITCISIALDFRGEYNLETVLLCAVSYLFALPISELLRDAKRQLYLKWFAILYSFISLVNLLGCYLLLLGVGTNILSSRFSFYKTRLSIGPHPNITAVLFSISIGMLVFLFFEAKKVATKVSLFLLICAYFPLLWLTNSRTSAVLMILFAMSMVFMACVDKLPKIDVKRTIILVLALCVLAAFLLGLYSVVFANHRDALLEASNTKVDLQKSFWNSLASFNGRTEIWKAAVAIIFDSWENFLFGTGNSIYFIHAHNAWIECFLRQGVFCFALSIYYTIRAVKAAIVILFSRKAKSTMAQKSVAMLLLVLLVVNTMEPYAFVNIVLLANFVFFLLLGYVMVWEKELREKRNIKERIRYEKI